MQALRRNLLPILVGLAAILATIVACGAVSDRFDDRHHRHGYRGDGRYERWRDDGSRDRRDDPRDRGRDDRRGEGDGRGFQMAPGSPNGGFGGFGAFGAFGGRILGVTVQSKDGGVEVQSVMPASPAAGAGVRPGDVIVRVDGRDVRDPQALREAVASARPGDGYEVVVRRDGREQVLRVPADGSPGGRPGTQPGMQPGFQPDGSFYLPPGMVPQGMYPQGMYPPSMPRMAPGMSPPGLPGTTPPTGAPAAPVLPVQ